MRATRRCTVIASAPVKTTRLPDGKLRVSDAATASARPAGRGGRPGPELLRCGRSEDQPVRSSAPILTERTPSLEAMSQDGSGAGASTALRCSGDSGVERGPVDQLLD